jgi:hypothetical protein
VERLTDRLTSAVLRVGEGRGFVVGYCKDARMVITAAHCLPVDDDGRLRLPPASTYGEQRTYPTLLGPLGGEATVWAELLFVDPVADIAVLGPPHGAELFDQFEAYQTLVANAHALGIADAPAQGRERVEQFPLTRQWVYRDTPGQGQGKFLALDGRWVKARLKRYGCRLSVEPGELAGRGISGSPILSSSGDAIGVLCSETASQVGEKITYCSRGNPVLMDCLPRWLWRR